MEEESKQEEKQVIEEVEEAEGVEVEIEKGEATQEQIKEVLEGKFYTIKELAGKLGYTTAWITWKCQAGVIKAVKPIGGQWRIPASEVDRIMKQGTIPLAKPKSKEPVTVLEVPPEKVDKVAPHPRTPVEEAGKEANPYWPLPFPLRGKER